MRKLAPWLVTMAVIVVAAAMLLRPYMHRIPVPGPNLAGARTRLESLGFRVVATSADGRSHPLDVEQVVAEQPASGSLYLSGLIVRLSTEPPSRTVLMPDLVGRSDADAVEVLTQAGLVTTHTAGGSVVVSQDASPGAEIPFGSTVTYRALFPHTPSRTSTEVVAVHGVYYLRYGIEGTPYCKPCHDAQTCTGPACHTSGAFERLRSMTATR